MSPTSKIEDGLTKQLFGNYGAKRRGEEKLPSRKVIKIIFSKIKTSKEQPCIKMNGSICKKPLSDIGLGISGPYFEDHPKHIIMLNINIHVSSCKNSQ